MRCCPAASGAATRPRLRSVEALTKDRVGLDDAALAGRRIGPGSVPYSKEETTTQAETPTYPREPRIHRAAVMESDRWWPNSVQRDAGDRVYGR